MDVSEKQTQKEPAASSSFFFFLWNLVAGGDSSPESQTSEAHPHQLCWTMSHSSKSAFSACLSFSLYN